MTTENTIQKLTIQEKRQKLQALSKTAEKIQEITPERTINEIVIEQFYKDEQNTEFHTFQEWRKMGYSVKKGSSAFVVWGKPREIKSKEEQEQANNDEKRKDKFFPISHIFSNAQVEPIEKKENE
ncbi:hypothetical protein SAMN05216480_10539 [Pustulibacterium marinum]|uniref:N-terminal domain-containing protein n=1 Tax=Pustulibacterium marinum TaxID=1224947 RepID=A0A1I7GKN1_9FLAO|nr:ArdC-like ssDNA-binding domain-containing protein [Pustulibacterium marinum]SFU49052.1 hypothetical protein SAMN05216480_10539 [Pustulibacterium marinum]